MVYQLQHYSVFPTKPPVFFSSTSSTSSTTTSNDSVVVYFVALGKGFHWYLQRFRAAGAAGVVAAAVAAAVVVVVVVAVAAAVVMGPVTGPGSQGGITQKADRISGSACLDVSPDSKTSWLSASGDGVKGK